MFDKKYLQWTCSPFLTWCKLTGPNGFCKMQTWRTLRCIKRLSADLLQQKDSLSLASSPGFQRMLEDSFYVMMVQIQPKLVRCEVTLPISRLSSEEPLPEVCTAVHCTPTRRKKIPITWQEIEIFNLFLDNKFIIGKFTFPPAFTLKALNKLFLVLFLKSSKEGCLWNPTLLP